MLIRSPYISAKAATTDCEQLYPLLKSSTAFCTLSSILLSFYYIHPDPKNSTVNLQHHRTMIGMHRLIQNPRTLQPSAYRLAGHTIIYSPAFIFGTRIKTVTPPGILLFFRIKQTERINKACREKTRHPFPLFGEETAILRITDRIMNINRFMAYIIITAKNQIRTCLPQLCHVFLKIQIGRASCRERV